jgi:hypothetical protein
LKEVCSSTVNFRSAGAFRLDLLPLLPSCGGGSARRGSEAERIARMGALRSVVRGAH